MNKKDKEKFKVIMAAINELIGRNPNFLHLDANQAIMAKEGCGRTILANLKALTPPKTRHSPKKQVAETPKEWWTKD